MIDVAALERSIIARVAKGFQPVMQKEIANSAADLRAQGVSDADIQAIAEDYADRAHAAIVEQVRSIARELIESGFFNDH